MLGPYKPYTNYERQVRFREGHPGYYNRYSAQRRAQEKAVTAAFPARWAAMQKAAAQPQQETATAGTQLLLFPE